MVKINFINFFYLYKIILDVFIKELWLRYPSITLENELIPQPINLELSKHINKSIIAINSLFLNWYNIDN